MNAPQNSTPIHLDRSVYCRQAALRCRDVAMPNLCADRDMLVFLPWPQHSHLLRRCESMKWQNLPAYK